ncbi:MAG: Mov34/MPN/PAD-1 family protein [Candidatus Promineifilaceae bacterium]
MTLASTSSENPESPNIEDKTTIEAEQQILSPAGRKSTLSSSDLVISHGTKSTSDPVQIVITQKALDQLQNHCYSVLDSEIGGVLLGKKESTDSGYEILIKASLPVRTDDHGPVHFTFSADSWATLHRERAVQYPHLDIVGWYHTHPGLGVFFSADDVVVHTAGFVMPWHVALVIDPIYREGCWFGWRTAPAEGKEAAITPLGGFSEVADDTSQSAASWKLVEARIWETSYPGQAQYRPADQVYAPASDWPSLPPISPWWGVLLGGTSLILVLLLLLDRLIAILK